MSGEITARDRTWAAIIAAGRHGNFKVDSVLRKMDYDEQPSRETVRRVLRSASELGVVDHKAGSQYYSLSVDADRIGR
jgi:Fe2+ or Zn2+ uptake regulation protein